jgi:hypothetical protein
MNNAEQQGRSQLESIVAMVGALCAAANDNEREAAQTTIQEDPLSIEVRGDWHAVGADAAKPSEFMILVCTGGPAVRIIGELDKHCEPENATVEYCDWFTAWHTLHGVTETETDALLEYCRQFYFADA